MDNTPCRVTADEYLLAAEYWHPDITYEDSRALLSAIRKVPVGAELAAAFGVPDEDQQDAHCWYYLLLAAEAATD